MINWDDVRLFLAVARAGGLAGAAGAANSSAPTLGRRILALERDLGVALFERHRLGYDLTPAGREFLGQAKAMEQGAMALERWRMAIDPAAVVKIAAGPWTNSFIAGHLHELQPLVSSPNSQKFEPIRVELLTGISFVDLARREANLGIRNRRPHQQGLACRKIGEVEFAIYGAAQYVDNHPAARSSDRFEHCDWVVLPSSKGQVPSLLWLEQYLLRPALFSCSSVHGVLEAAGSGAGLCILPIFIGDNDDRMVRVSETIAELKSSRWLVSHDDDRHNKPIRLIADRLVKLFAQRT